jgi:hypothetical protein
MSKAFTTLYWPLRGIISNTECAFLKMEASKNQNSNKNGECSEKDIPLLHFLLITLINDFIGGAAKRGQFNLNSR